MQCGESVKNIAGERIIKQIQVVPRIDKKAYINGLIPLKSGHSRRKS